MARNQIRLDSSGVAEILKSAGAATVTKAAALAIAANIRDQGIKVGDRDGGPREVDLPVEVKVVTTDRAHAIVAITHPAGQAVQAKHGALSKAAAAAGLSVHR